MKAVIIEDEHLIAKELALKINSVAADVEIIEILPSLKTAKKWFLNNAEPDVIFMDIQLSDGVSFELLETFKLSCPIIFTTAYDEYAIKAFKANGVDYLLKPVDEDELNKAINRSRLLVNANKPAVDLTLLLQNLSQNTHHSYKEKFIINSRNTWIPVETKDIAYFTKENLNYAVTFNSEKYILDYSTLEDIEALIDPRIFYRANRQFIINAGAIQNIKPQENQKLVITLKTPLKIQIDISREKAPAFKKWFDK
ncbi:MAG: DNA-binding response regulator [Chitinophaga sp.]|jgi:DNA-binding LytR/AlgR family response regulator|nr:DNA-binding response regulator [Chitinophaga sp.]